MKRPLKFQTIALVDRLIYSNEIIEFLNQTISASSITRLQTLSIQSSKPLLLKFQFTLLKLVDSLMQVMIHKIVYRESFPLYSRVPTTFSAILILKSQN